MKVVEESSVIVGLDVKLGVCEVVGRKVSVGEETSVGLLVGAMTS